MEAGSMRHLRLLSMADSTGFFATQRYLCASHRRRLAHQLGRCDLGQSGLVQILRGCIHRCREKCLEQSHTHLSSIWPRSVRSCRKCLHNMHSIGCLHVIRMPYFHKSPSGKYPKDFRWRGTLTWICCQTRSGTIQNTQKSKGFVSNICRDHDPETRDLQIFLLSVRSRVICQVLASLHCRMGTSSQNVVQGFKPFQECPSELFSS